MKGRCWLAVAGATVALLLASASSRLAAQSKPFALEPRAGIALPLGTLAEVQGAGVHAALAAALWPTSVVGLRIEGAMSLMSEKQGTAPTNLFHYGAGLEIELTAMSEATWDIDLYFTAGGTTLSRRSTQNPDFVGTGSDSFFSLNAGLRILEEVHPDIEVLVDIQWYLLFSDKEKTDDLALEFEGLGTSSLVPLTVGARIRL